jgi:hypothetical protein
MSVESAASPVLESVESSVADVVFEAVNSVVLAGIIAEPGEGRQIAGGVEVVKWTLRVNRGPGRPGSDLIDCIALEPVLQQRALAWALGTPLIASGAIRRRFWRAAGRTTTRVEVEVDEVTLFEAA